MGTSFLVSCGGGGGGGSEENGGDRPLSLNGVTLEFEGANLTFSTTTPNSSSGSTESGGIVYQRISDTDLEFISTNPIARDPLLLSWPADLGGSTSYEYTPIDGITGRLIIYANSTEPGTFLRHGGTNNFDVFTLTFTASAGVITSINSVTRVNIAGEGYSIGMALTGRVATLTANPRPLPAGWNGINEGPGFVADPSFAGKTLTLDENGTNTEIIFGTFVSSGPPVTLISQTRETGTVAVSVNTPPNVETYQASYILIQPFGTEESRLTVNYTSATTPPLPQNEIVTLTFRAGELLIGAGSAVDVRTGTYTRTDLNVTMGTFILDRRIP